MGKARASASRPDRTAAPSDPVEYPRAGFRIGEYVIEDMLGQGSMSTVFLARDGTGHEVALKVVRAGPEVSETMIERFGREIEACKQLRSHPHIITVFATGSEDAFQYIAMQRIEGSKTLRSLMEPGRLSIETAVDIVTKIARALAYAHARNILHRDVKPTNIMIDQFGEPVLADFGVAALIDWPRFTVPGALTGTPLYMSPEQSRGEPLTPSSDVYSLGVVLYEAVTGAMPYSAHRNTGVQETLRAVRSEPPRRPRALREDISMDLEAVMLNALAKDPLDRYQSAEAFAAELERAMDGRPVTARHYGPVQRVQHFVMRYSHFLVVLGLLLCVMVLGMTVSVHWLRRVQYQELLGLARLRNSQHALVRMTRSAGPAVQAVRARQEVHLARADMAAQDWEQAAEGLQRAVEAGRIAGDERTVAVAELELARSLTMLNRRRESTALYGRVIVNPETTPDEFGQALLEAALLTYLDGDESARNRLLQNPVPYDASVSGAFGTVLGEESPLDLVSRIPDARRDVQNDLYLTAAVVAWAQGSNALARVYFDACVASSPSPSEWPAPLAIQLREELLR